MAKTRRVQVRMDPGELRGLGAPARKWRSSALGLMRDAPLARPVGGLECAQRVVAASAFLELPDAPLPDWAELKQELEERRG